MKVGWRERPPAVERPLRRVAPTAFAGDSRSSPAGSRCPAGRCIPHWAPARSGTAALIEVDPNQRLGAGEVWDGRVYVSGVEEVEKLDVRLPGRRPRLARLRTVDAERPHHAGLDVETSPSMVIELRRAEAARLAGPTQPRLLAESQIAASESPVSVRMSASSLCPQRPRCQRVGPTP